MGTPCLGMRLALPERFRAAGPYLGTISWQNFCHALPPTQVHEVRQETCENVLVGSRRKLFSPPDRGPELANSILLTVNHLLLISARSLQSQCDYPKGMHIRSGLVLVNGENC